ncbi:MAG: hypothetical protein U0165_12245 [Polyangiaceae bacterium]
MPTWPEIQAYARSKYRLAKDEPEKFAVVFKEADNRTQMIWVRKFTAFNQEWLEFKSYFAKEAELAPAVALRLNGELPIGSIALLDGYYALLHNAPLKNLDVEEFELPFNYLATKADQLERTYSAGKDDY